MSTGVRSTGYMKKQVADAEAVLAQVEAERDAWKRWLGNAERDEIAAKNELDDVRQELAAMTQWRNTLQADLLLAETHIGQQAREAQAARRERQALHAEVRGLMEKLDEVTP